MATTAEMLAEAEREYHLLRTGQKARVVVDQNGERVEFTAANRADLKAYIDELKAALGTSTAPLGPMRILL